MTIEPQIKADELNLSGANQASIKNNDLLNALVTSQEKAVNFLKQTVSSIELSQITVDEYGAIVIDNDEFRQVVKGFINNPVSAANWNCGGNGGCHLE
jgi:hypothetical protein